MGTSINSEIGGKLLKSESHLLYDSMDKLGIEFYYDNKDYDCPNLHHGDVVKILDSELISKDTLLYKQLEDIESEGYGLMLVY